MALELGGGRVAAGDADAFCVRPATEDDVAFVVSLDGEAHPRSLLTAVRDEALWRFALRGPREERFRSAPRVIARTAGGPVGFLAHGGELWGGMLSAHAYELVGSWLNPVQGDGGSRHFTVMNVIPAMLAVLSMRVT